MSESSKDNMSESPTDSASESSNDPMNESSIDRMIRRRTLFAFATWILLGTAAVCGFLWLKNRPQDQGVQGPLRKILNANEAVFNKSLDDGHLARTYPLSAAVTHVRVNGDVGMSAGFDPKTWKLQVVRTSGDTLLLGIEDIRRLPKTEIVFDFKCIEGWSQVTHWAGARFSDFIKFYHLDAQASMKYVGMRTPDKAYYVGIDMRSALHPQTLLCYEMNGKPLPLNQGAPLRLIIPVKYGIKNIKRIGTMTFSNERPPDYWFERGYDYYSGL
jgi:DMSO/TMAO reductase YedYZ molybdopterin-dependent catalytic subunit